MSLPGRRASCTFQRNWDCRGERCAVPVLPCGPLKHLPKVTPDESRTQAMTRNQTERNTCNICNQSFTSERELQEHQSKAHSRQVQGGEQSVPARRHNDPPDQQGRVGNEWGNTKNTAPNAVAGAKEPQPASSRAACEFREEGDMEDETAEDVLPPRRRAS
jgi:hypothetical protein